MIRDSLWYKRIPTLFGLLLLGVGIVSINFALNKGAFFITRATPTYAPEQVRITNLTDTSLSVSYITQDAVLGTVSYGTTSTGGKVALDDRDQQSGNPLPYTVHHITIKNLSPDTDYFFRITSSDRVFLDNDKSFATKTLPSLAQNPTRQPPIVGGISHSDGSKDNNILVLLVTENAQTLSVLTKPDGNFVMPLNAIRSKDFLNYLTFSDADIIKLLALTPTGKATVSVLPKQISPVPPVTIGNTYDFTSSLVTSPTPIASQSASEASFPSFTATEASPPEPQIISPDEKAGLSDSKPEFEGTALPNTEVSIEIHSENNITSSVTSDKNGSWTYRPTTKLDPGVHTITIKTKDSNGILQTITRSFTVFAEGSQFIEPSISPPAPSVTPIPIQIPTATPTLVATPTITATPTPSSPDKIGVQSGPTATIEPPPAGGPTDILTQPPLPIDTEPGAALTTFYAILGTITLGAGLLILLLARGSSL